MLTLRLVSDGTPGGIHPEERTLANGKLSLGRSSDNDWPLNDAERTLSKRHCEISQSGNGWVVRDTSTNGIFLNNAPAPVGYGKEAPLSDGDSLRLGHYVFEVYIAKSTASVAAVSSIDALLAGPSPSYRRPPARGMMTEDEAVFSADPHGPRATPQPPPTFGNDLYDRPKVRAASGWGKAESGEKDLLGPVSSPIWDGPSEADHRPSEAYAFVPPEVVNRPVLVPEDDDLLAPAAPPSNASQKPFPAAPPASAAAKSGSVIPDDWDDDFLSAPPSKTASTPVSPPPVAPSPVASAPAQQQPPNPVVPELPGAFDEPLDRPPAPPIPRPQTAAFQAGAQSDLFAAFLGGAGLKGIDPGHLDQKEFMQAAGQIVREAVLGLYDILAARTMVKSTFAMQRTMLQGANNNPLKFTPDREEALRKVLLDPGKGFLPGLAAVRDGVRDVRAHEIALIGGVQVALKALVEKFNPEQLKGRLDTSSFLSSLIPGSRKARYWEVYELLYEKIARDVEDDFQNAFGRAVAVEYEAKLNELESKEGSGG